MKVVFRLSLHLQIHAETYNDAAAADGGGGGVDDDDDNLEVSRAKEKGSVVKAHVALEEDLRQEPSTLLPVAPGPMEGKEVLTITDKH